LALEGTLVGMDVSDEMIRRAREKSSAVENALFIWASGEEIPWQENFFTRVLSVEALYYAESIERVLREIHRVLAPGGSVWIINHLSKENNLSLRWIPELKVPVQLLSAEEYAELLARIGYEGFSHRMLSDTRPVPQGTPPAPFRDAAELRRFYELGALLLTARKPSEPRA
jgi:ubiquinone/menaquinone biosynthesis C-methylase UbiE